jgi:hypothetical protein
LGCCRVAYAFCAVCLQDHGFEGAGGSRHDGNMIIKVSIRSAVRKPQGAIAMIVYSVSRIGLRRPFR